MRAHESIDRSLLIPESFLKEHPAHSTSTNIHVANRPISPETLNSPNESTFSTPRNARVVRHLRHALPRRFVRNFLCKARLSGVLRCCFCQKPELAPLPRSLKTELLKNPNALQYNPKGFCTCINSSKICTNPCKKFKPKKSSIYTRK